MAFNDLKRYISNAAKLAGEARKREQASDIAQTIQSGAAQATVKLPQTQSARQRMMFQEEKQDRWYKNDQPTSSEILARIYTVSQQDFSRGEQLWNTFQTFQNDPASPIYNPYVVATNSAVASMAGLGYDMRGGVTKDWLEQNRALVGNYRTGSSGTPLAPSSQSTPENDAAYWYYKILSAEPETENAETEWEALQEEVRYWTRRADRNYSDEEILAKINWADYPTLVRMDEGRKKGTPIALNRPVGYSQDALYGVIWGARNDSTGDPLVDSVKAALGQGNSWREDASLAARLDPTSAEYSPYSTGSTLDDAALYFGVSEFSPDWLDSNRSYLGGNDATARQMYQKVYDAEQTTLQAEEELKSLWDSVDEWMKYSSDPDVILSGLLDDCPTLKKMDESRKSGNLIATTRAVDYRWEDVEAEVRRRCEQVNTAMQGGAYTEQLGDTLGIPLPHAESDIALEKSRDNAINAGAGTIMDQGTEEEKSVFQTAYSSNFGDYLLEINRAINEGVTDPQGGYAYCLERADSYAAENYLDAKAVVAPYETMQQSVQAAQAELDTINGQLWVQQDLHSGDENADQAGAPLQDRYHTTAVVDGSSWELYAERVEGTTQYRFTGAYNVDTGEFLDPIPGAMGASLTAKGELFAQSIGSEGETTERKDYTPEEQERMVARVEELEDVITSGNAYLQTHAGAYENSRKTMQQIDDGYAVADRMAELAGLEKGDASSTKAALDFVYAFGAEYKPTQWMAEDLYTAALQEGNSYDQVARAAQMGSQANRDAISQIDYALDWIESSGAVVDQRYLDNMMRERARLERETKAAEYFLLQGNADFDSVVAKAMANVDRPAFSLSLSTDWSDSDLAYYAAQLVGDKPLTDRPPTGMSLMTDQERKTFLYLYGKEGADAAREYYDYMTDPTYGVVEVRNAQLTDTVSSDLARNMPVASSILSVIASPMQIAGTVYSVGAVINGREINPYNNAFGPTQMVGGIRGTVKEGITAALGEGSVGSFLANLGYDAVTAAGDSLVNSYLVGGLAGIGGGEAASGLSAISRNLLAASPMGVQAAGSAIRDAKLRGADDTQALMMGGATFLAETLSEAITVGNIRAAFKKGETAEAAKGFLRALLKDGLEEGIGETASEFLSAVSDEAIMGTLSNRRAVEQEYITNGMDPETALWQSWKDAAKEMLYAGLTGFVSSGVSTGAGYAAGALNRSTGESTLPANEGSKGTPVDAESTTLGEADFPFMTNIFSPDAIETENAAQQNGILSRQMAALTMATTTTDEASVTATIGAVLQQSSDGSNSMAGVAAQHMVSRLGAVKAATVTQNVLLTAAENGIPVEQAQSALAVAALASGQAQQVLGEIADNNAMSPESIAMLTSAAEADMQDPAIMQQVEQTVTNNRVATRVAAIVADGGLEGIASYEMALGQARQNRDNAQAALEQARRQQTVAAENLQSAYAQFSADPGNQTMRGAVQQAIKDAEGAAKVVAEYEQSLSNAETAMQGAKTTLDQMRDSTMRRIRQQAQEEVLAVTGQAAQLAEEQKYQEAISLLNPIAPFGKIIQVDLKDGGTVGLTGAHLYDTGGYTYFTTTDGSVISEALFAPGFTAAPGFMDAVSNGNMAGLVGAKVPHPTVFLPHSVPVQIDATGEVVQVIGFAPDMNNQATYVMADGSTISAWDTTPENASDSDYLADIYEQNEQKLAEQVQITETPQSSESAETQVESEEGTSETAKTEPKISLKDWQDSQYHGKPKPLRNLRTNTANFQKWFNDPSGDLTNPDGTPRIIYRGTGSKLYMEHKAGGKSGQVINFYTPDLSIAKSYASGSTHIISTYDIVNWETAAKAMQAEGFKLQEVQQGGQWGYQAVGITAETAGVTGDFYRENELNRFNKEYGGVRRSGLYEGYVSVKNPLVIDGNGAPYTRTHATVKDKNGNDYTATMKNRDWGEWAAKNGYDACIVRNTLDYLYDNHSGRKPGTVIMTFSPTSFKSKYNTGKLGKTNPDIRYYKAGSFALTGEPISQQMQGITKRLAAGQMVDEATVMATPEVQWAEAHQLEGSSLPDEAENWSPAEYAEHIGPERASLQEDVLDELLARGSAVFDSNGKAQYTGPVKQEKRLDVVIGPPAAGKSSALVDPISQKFGSRVLDSDDVKARLPEFGGGLNSGYLHNESRFVWKQMQARAIALGDNVVLPIVGGKQSSVEKTIKPYIEAGYSVNLHYMELDGRKAVGRGLNRFLSNGRYITPTYLFSVNNGGVEATYEAMKNGGSIDGYSKWNNDVPLGQHPRFVEGSALQDLYERGPVGVQEPGDGGPRRSEGQGMGGSAQSQAAADPQSQAGSTLKYSMNTQQQQPQGVSSTPKGTPKSSPAKIAKDLVKALGLGNAVGTKRMNRVPQAVAGYYEARARYIAVRSRQAGNYTVTMHEVFHNLADRLNMTGTQDMVNNLDPVFAANYTPAELPGEAFAEFGWRYMESETLARQFAGDAFVDQFEARLRQAGLQKTVHNAARQLRIWLNATVNDRIGATIVDKNKATKPGSIRDQLRAMISQHIDDTAAAEPVNASIRKESGNNNIPLNQDVRANALMKNFASRRAYAILTENLTDANWNVTGESLASRFERVGLKAKDAELLNEYMLALHSLDRDAQGKPVFDTVGVPADQRQRLIDDVQQNHPEVAAAEKEFQAFRKEFLRAFLVDTGYLSQADFDKMNAMYPHYVPTYRVKNGGRRGGSSKTYRIRRASGSTEDIINPMDSFVSMVDSVVTMVSANNAALAWDSAYRQNEGLGAFGREITPDMHQVSVDVSRLQNQIAQLLSGNTDADVFQQVIDLIGTRQIQWVPQSAANMANVITVQRSDGSVGYYEMFDPELYKLLSSQRDGSGSSNKLWSTLGKVTRAMSMLTTGSNPVFAVRNFMRDFQNSVNYGSWASNYGSGFMKWMRAAYDVWTKSGEYQDYVALGGGGWTRIEAGTKKGANAYRSALYKGYNTSSMANAVKWAGQKVWDTVTLSRLNEVIEQTSRFAEYRYGKHDKSTSEGKMEAFLAAQDVTVDFARMGNSGTASVLKQLVPFLGASTQGVYRTGRSLTEAERGRAPQRFAKTVINTALASAISAAIMLKFSDDEEKEAFAMMSNDLKAQHLYFPNFAKDVLGQQPLIRIPLAQDPLTYAIHGAVTDAIWNGTTDEMVIDVAAIANTVVDNLNPFGNGTIFEPLLAVTRNKNWYGSRIVPSYMGDWDASTQYTEETPGLFVAAGRALNMSPLNIQYLAEQYSGFLGQMVVPAISRDEAGGLGGLEATIAAVQKRFTSDPLISNDVVGSVYDNAAFLTQVTDAAKNNRPANMLRRGLSEDERKAAYQEAYDLTRKGGIIADAKTFLSDGYDRIDEINANDTLTPEQKYTLTSDVRREMIEVALEANEAAAAYNEKYVAGLNIATNALYEGAYLTIPTAMDKLDQVFKADSDQMYMQRATEVWEATGNDSALPHPNTSYTSKGVTYEVGVEDMENWVAQYKMGYQDYLVRKGARWDAMSDEEKLELLKSAHSAGHDAARKWHMKLHGIK